MGEEKKQQNPANIITSLIIIGVIIFVVWRIWGCLNSITETTETQQKDYTKYIGTQNIKYDQGSDWIEITGTVKNNSSETLYFVQLKLSLYDSSNYLLTSQTNYIDNAIDGIEGGAFSSFSFFIEKNAINNLKIKEITYDITCVQAKLK